MLGDVNQQNILQLHVKAVVKVDFSQQFLVYVYQLRVRAVAKFLKRNVLRVVRGAWRMTRGVVCDVRGMSALYVRGARAHSFLKLSQQAGRTRNFRQTYTIKC